MPYASNADLPKSVAALPEEAKTVFRRVINAELDKGHAEERAFATAWTAVKNGWTQDGDGKWSRKAQKFESAVQIAKVDESLGLVFGFAIVSKVDGEPYHDVQGDYIPEDAMLKAGADFMANSRVAKEMHAGDKIGEVVFAFPLTEDIAKSLDITTKKTGLLIAMKPSAEVLAKFRSGEFAGFSIGGRRIIDEDVA